MDKSEKDIIEKIKHALNEEGAKILIDDIKRHLQSADTAKVLPVVDNITKNVLSSTTEELLKRQGYVSALEWVVGTMEYYQTFDFTEIEDDI